MIFLALKGPGTCLSLLLVFVTL